MSSELRTACERLVAIVRSAPEEDYCHPFGFANTVPEAGSAETAHRCLSQAEADAKLRAIERLTDQPINDLLPTGWERLSPAQLLAVEEAVRTLEVGERSQPLGDHAPAWCRLDEQLFRLAFTAWIKGLDFAVAPRPRALARQLKVDLDGYRKALQKLRAVLAQPSAPSARWPPRVDLWLGDPPTDEAGLPMPRLWVSACTLKLTEADATKIGLLPANTQAQERSARRELCRRWVLREDDSHPTELENVHQQFTICCRCSQTLAVA